MSFRAGQPLGRRRAQNERVGWVCACQPSDKEEKWPKTSRLVTEDREETGFP
jgi:hypothetical protein